MARVIRYGGTPRLQLTIVKVKFAPLCVLRFSLKGGKRGKKEKNNKLGIRTAQRARTHNKSRTEKPEPELVTDWTDPIAGSGSEMKFKK